MSNFIHKLNKNKIFKFISSIRLAVPLMLVLGACVAWGTVVESSYNAEYAGMAIYKSTWFGLLLSLLWINIFCATISRIPFKLHHTGFVITHIGLLTLLIGGFITNSEGIDGQLVVAEGQSSSTVILPHLMIGYQYEGTPTPQIVKFKKTIHPQDQSDLKNINDLLGQQLQIKKYIPFAKIEKDYIQSTNSEDQAVAVSFILKSNFFNVSEWLHSDTNPEMKLGPATLKIVQTDDLDRAPTINAEKKSSPQKNKARVINSVTEKAESSDSYLVITHLKNPSDTQKIKISDLKQGVQKHKNIKIKLVRFYQHAVVSNNKMTEGDASSPPNPAIELAIESNGQSVREVLYAQFAGFSINKNGIFDYKYEFKSKDIASTPSSPHGSPTDTTSQAAHATTTTPTASNTEDQSPAMAAMKGDNTIIFSVDPKQSGKARVTLMKNKVVVLTQILNEGQSLETPWMGMKIFLGSVKSQAVEQIIARPVVPEKSQDLPPSAMLVSTIDNPQNEFWLTEGNQKQIVLNQKPAVIYFGRQTIDLPFDLKLEKFSKLDYPGTTTPMSFESLVQIGRTGVSQKISMNEPFKMEGFTIYQASYSMTPNETLSIFSVNKDPGRFLKYLGSLILSLGIITITVMRSRVWKNYLNRRSKNA